MTRKLLPAALIALSMGASACMGHDPVGLGSNGQDNQPASGVIIDRGGLHGTGISTSPGGLHH